MTQGTIRVGVGGWVFEPWRGVFYPKDLKQKDELSYLSRKLRVIEINGTYYSLQKKESWAKWAAETPEGFKFTVKGSRFSTNRRELASAGESIARFMAQGLSELGDKLGPIVWQFANTKRFDPDDFSAFLDLLPASADGIAVRHAVEVRHDSFITPEFPALLRSRKVGLVYADHAVYPQMADVTADFIYARLQTGSDDIPTAYSEKDLATWAGRLTTWAAGGEPDDLPRADPAHNPPKAPREVFCFIIHEGKVRAPHGAEALQRLPTVNGALTMGGKAAPMRRVAILALLPAALLVSAQTTAPAPASPAPPPAPSAEQCRTACAQRYYFCLAESEPETCSPVWAQCRAGCGSSLPR